MFVLLANVFHYWELRSGKFSLLGNQAVLFAFRFTSIRKNEENFIKIQLWCLYFVENYRSLYAIFTATMRRIDGILAWKFLYFDDAPEIGAV